MSELQKRKTHGLAVASLVLGCFFIIPLLGFIFGLLAIVFGVIALVSISNNNQAYKGNGFAITGLILGILGVILVPILALFAAIAIPNFLRARLNANEAQARSTISAIASAAMVYNADNGRYPVKEADLVSAEPPYLNQSYSGTTVNGYNYQVRFTPNNYTIVASPKDCRVTGVKVFTMKDGELLEADCR